MPAARAAAVRGVAAECSGDRPGENTRRLHPSSSVSGRPPVLISTPGIRSESCSRPAGCSRVSAIRTCQPVAAKNSAHAAPEAPQPNTKAFFVSDIFFTDQRILSVAKPINTKINVMIQKRTTTCVSFQPFNSK